MNELMHVLFLMDTANASRLFQLQLNNICLLLVRSAILYIAYIYSTELVFIMISASISFYSTCTIYYVHM